MTSSKQKTPSILIKISEVSCEPDRIRFKFFYFYLILLYLCSKPFIERAFGVLLIILINIKHIKIMFVLNLGGTRAVQINIFLWLQLNTF